MKKTLYSTTALAAAGLLTLGASDAFAQAAAPAAPEKLKMAIGGFFTAYMGYADQRASFENSLGGAVADYNNFDLKNDSEINFKGSVKLDNGMTVRLQVEFETDPANAGSSSAATTNFGLDESWMGIDTNGYGEVRLGSQKFSHLTLGVSAPNSGALNPGNSDTSLWVVRPSSGMSVPAALGFPSGADNQRVVYLSPTIAGFRFGADYAPSTTETDAQGVASGQSTEASAASAIVQYSGDVAGYGFRTSAAYIRSDGKGTSQWNGVEIGADIKIADFTIGGHYHRQWSPSNSAPIGGSAAALANANNSAETDGFNAGISYNPGPWKVGFRTTQQFHEGNRTRDGRDQARLYKLGGNYTLGPGVELTGDLFRLSWIDEDGNKNNENVGWALVGGIAVTF